VATGRPTGGSGRGCGHRPAGAASKVILPSEAGIREGEVQPDAWSGSGSGVDDLRALVRRNDRLLLISTGAYALLLAALMAVRGVSIGLDVMLLGVGLLGLLVARAAPQLGGRLPALVRDTLPFLALFLAYELMRGYSAAVEGPIHTDDVLGLERWLFFGHVPTQVLQQAFHPASGADLLAMTATVFYFLHFALPVIVGVVLWVRRPAAFYDFVAGLIILSVAGFSTYLVLPVAPPWYAAETGWLAGPDGAPMIEYLKQQGFNDLARLFGLDGNAAFSFAIRDVNPNLVGAFPSLHAGYPMLAFLILRRSFGRPAWLMLAYAAAVWLSVVYLADHYVVDLLGGIAYAAAACWLVVEAPSWLRWAAPRSIVGELRRAVGGLRG